ncbi:histidine ammonia-lyase [Arthrobacter castelli]|uniref:histidine ammonia-lyase n=1 Tax=Arthrobacter castelli TaxID=271431 RepID=UPI0004134BC5|nr:histidine ammonia-lyase [Arthrobacter castelli]
MTGTTTSTVEVSVGPLAADDVVAVTRDDAQIRITDESVRAMTESRDVIESMVDDDQPHYGVSTGFGALATKHVPVDMRAQLQRSLIRSHAASSGAEVDREIIRGLMLLRLSTLATGRTGVRPSTAQAYAGILNAGITPVVREYGSLGCSGDLAPLSHCALALMGEGEVRNRAGELMNAGDALAAAGLSPVELREKEGLALINGTDGMLGMLLMASSDLHRLLKIADISAAMTVEGLLGTDAVFAEDLNQLRPHPGQGASAANIRSVLGESPLIGTRQSGEDGKRSFTRVQDAYSVRCAPQVHGAARATLAHAESVAGYELDSAVDNPVVTLDGRIESNGNFHGAPVGYVLDFLAIAVADLASMSERRTDRFLDPARNHGLNAFLADDPGVDSGHMIAQYTQAGIVSELKRLAAPASADSIPSSAMQEDHVSMGWSAGLKLRRAIDGLSRVLAVELLTSARALDMRDGGVEQAKTAPATTAVRKLIRTVVPAPGTDRYLAPEIEAVRKLVESGDALTTAEEAIGSELS